MTFLTEPIKRLTSVHYPFRFNTRICFRLMIVLFAMIVFLQKAKAQFGETLFYDSISKISTEGIIEGGYSEGKFIYLTGGSFSRQAPIPSLTKMDTAGNVIWTATDQELTGLLDKRNYTIDLIKGTTIHFVKDGDKIYTTSRHQNLWCVSDSTGALIWNIQIPGDLVLKLIDFSSTELLMLTGHLGIQYHIINKQTGKIVYTRELLSSINYAYTAEMLVDNNKNILIGCGDTCYKYRDKLLDQLLWKSSLPYNNNKSVDKILQDSDRYIISGLNNVRAIDTLTGNMIWYNHIVVGAVPLIQTGGDANPKKLIIKDSMIFVSWVSPVVGGLDLKRSFTLTCINKTNGNVRYNVAYDFTGVPPDPSAPTIQEELDWPMDYTMDATGNIYITGSYDNSSGPQAPGNWGIMKINGATGDKMYESTITNDVLHRSLGSQGMYIEYKYGKLYAAGNLANVYNNVNDSKPVLLSFDSIATYKERFRISPMYTIRYPSSLAGMVPLMPTKMALLKMVGRSSVVELRNGYNQLIWNKTFFSATKFMVPQMIQNLHDTAVAVTFYLFKEEPQTKMIIGEPDSVVFIRLDTMGNIKYRQQIKHNASDQIAPEPVQIYTDAYNKTNFIYRRWIYNSYTNNYFPSYFSYMMESSQPDWSDLTGDQLPVEETGISMKRTVANHFNTDTMVIFRSTPGFIRNGHFCSTVQAAYPIGYKGFYTKKLRSFYMIFSSIKADSVSHIIFGRDSSGQMLTACYNFNKPDAFVWNNAQSAGSYYAGDTSDTHIYSVGKQQGTNKLIISKMAKANGTSTWNFDRGPQQLTTIIPLDFRFNRVSKEFILGGFIQDSSFGQIKNSYFYFTLDSNGSIIKDVIRTGELFSHTKIRVINNLQDGPHFYGGQLSTIGYSVAGFYNADCFGNALIPAVIIHTPNTNVTPGSSILISSSVTNIGSNSTYQWQDSTQLNNWQNIIGATSATILYKPLVTNDKLRCIVTSNIACAMGYQAISKALQFRVEVNTAINQLPVHSKNIRIYPNPVKDLLIIDSINTSEKWQTIEIISGNGQHFLTQLSIQNQTKVSVNVSYLQNGVYVAILRRKQALPLVLKFVKL